MEKMKEVVETNNGWHSENLSQAFLLFVTLMQMLFTLAIDCGPIQLS
jgi:hypothetical protein